MEYKLYIEKIREQLDKMSEADKTAWIYLQARTTNESNRQRFLDSLLGNSGSNMELTPDEINRWCEAIESGEIYITRQWEEDYDSWNSWDPDYYESYIDEHGIEEFLTKALRTCRQLIFAKKYDIACLLLARITALEVDICDDSLEGMTLKELVRNDVIMLNTKELFTALIYSCYQTYEGRKRLEMMYSYISRDSDIYMTDAFAYGPEELQEIDSFMSEWRDFLAKKTGDRAGALLIEASMYIGGETMLLETAIKASTLHPALYEKYCQIMHDSGRHEECISVAKEALTHIDRNNPVCGSISELAIKSGQDNPDLIKDFYISAFCGEPSMYHLLRLFMIDDSKMLSQALDRVDSMDNGTSKEIFKFVLGQYDDIIRSYIGETGNISWSFNPKTVIAYLAFIALKKDKSYKSAAEKTILEEIKRISRYDSKESEQFYKLISAWRKSFRIDDNKKQEYIKWLKSETYRSADAIVEGKQRENYDTAACLIVMLEEIINDNGMEQDISRSVYGYRQRHSRKRAFVRELDAMMY